MKRYILIVLLLTSIGYAGLTEITTGEHTFGSTEVYDRITIINNAILNIEGSKIDSMFSFDNSRINFYDGNLSYGYVGNDSEFHYYGGNIQSYLYYDFESDYVSGKIHIYGTGLYFDYKWVRGTLSNGDPLNLYIRVSEIDPERVILHEIPEPTTIVLLGLGFIAIWKR